MSMGTALLGMMGTKDPREALLARVMAASQQPASAQYAAPGQDPAASTVGQDPAAQPRTTPQPEAYKSPDDLSALYKDLLSYNSKAQNIDRGIGLLGAAFAQPENRGAILQMFGGQGDVIDTDPSKMAELSMAIQKNAASRSMMASQMASLPGIAEKYGIDLPTAQLLMQQGKLEDFIAEREKQDFGVKNRPVNTDVVDGQIVSTNQNTGEEVTRVGEKKLPKVELRDVDGQIIGFDDQGNKVSEFGTKKPNEVIVDGPNGAKYLYDPDTQTVVKSLLQEDRGTTETKEYERYVADETIRGTPGDKIMKYQDWRMTKPASTKIDINSTEDTEFTKQLDKEQAKNYVAIQNSAKSARDSLGQYDVAEKALKTGLRTGFGAETEVGVRKLLSALGFEGDTSKMAAADVFSSVQNQLAMIKRNPESGMGLPGSVSDRDLVFLKQADVNFGATAEGNKNIIQIARKLGQRKIEVAKMAAAYVRKNKRLDEGFDEELAKYADENPLFDDLSIGGTKTDDEKADQYLKQYGGQ